MKNSITKNPKLTRAGIAILLSKLKQFDAPNAMEEQYSTDSETAASLLWDLYAKEKIKGKIIADLGAGIGILGIAAAILSAKTVYLVEKDIKAAKIAEENIKLAENLTKSTDIKKRIKIFNQDIADFSKCADLVIMNPPFGTKQKHADSEFLRHAFKISDEIYSFHKASTAEYIKEFCERNGFAAEKYFMINLPIKKSQKFHTRSIHRIDVVCFKISKILI